MDDVFYNMQNPDVAAAGMDPDVHYALFGQQEGRQPNQFFTLHLCCAEPVLPATFEHYLTRMEGRTHRPSSTARATWRRIPTWLAAGMNPLAHFLQFGRYEGRQYYPVTAEELWIPMPIRSAAVFLPSWLSATIRRPREPTRTICAIPAATTSCSAVLIRQRVQSHGNDILIAGIGDDTLYGDGGNDQLEGGFGNDIINGGDGDDIITDTGGDDNIKAEGGNDVVHAGPGLDLVMGGDGTGLHLPRHRCRLGSVRR